VEFDLELGVVLLLPRRGLWLLEDPARMRDGHVGGMAAGSEASQSASSSGGSDSTGALVWSLSTWTPIKIAAGDLRQ